MLRALLLLPVVGLHTLAFGLLGIAAGLVDERRGQAVARAWGRSLLALLGVTVELRGQPFPGAAVYAANHVNALDIPILFGWLPADFRVIFKRSLALVPLVGWFLAAAGHLPIDRRNAFHARHSLERAAARLRAGLSVAAFPEGTRRGSRGLGRFKRGTFVLALQAQVPVVPVSLCGVERRLPRGLSSFTPGPVRLCLHAPVPTAGLGVEDGGDLAERVRAQVARGLEEA